MGTQQLLGNQLKASQQGELRWSYSITSSDDSSNSFATRFGKSERAPLLSRVMLPSASTNKSETEERSLLNLNVPNLLLVNTTLSSDGKGIILHLREVEGEHAIIDTRRLLEETGAESIEEVSVLEEHIQTFSKPILIEHYETKFIKLNF